MVSVRQFGPEHGLLHREASQVAQDREGFLWIASPAGLLRFDGYTFKAYTTSEGLSTNAINTIWPDADGLLWLVARGRYSDGHVASIDILDPATGQVSTFAEHFGDKAPCRADELAGKALQLHDGSLLMGTEGKLLMYRSAAAGFEVTPVATDGVLRPVMVNKNGGMHCVRYLRGQAYQEFVVIGTQGEVLETSEDKYRSGPIGNVLNMDMRRSSTGLYFKAQLESDESAYEFWLSPEGTLRRFPKELGKEVIDFWNSYGGERLPLLDDLWLVDGQVRRMQAGDDPTEALEVFDLLSKYPGLGSGLKHYLYDKMGNTWLATDMGLWCVRVGRSAFQRYCSTPGLLGRSMRGLLLHGDTLLAHAELLGHWRVDLRTGIAKGRDTASVTLRYVLRSDGDGGYWSSEGQTLFHFKGNGSLKQMDTHTRFVWSILPMADGRLLLGLDEGLAWTDTTLSGYQLISFPQHTRLDRATVTHFHQDRQGTIWASTNVGLCELDRQGNFINLWRLGSEGSHLPADAFNHMYEDDNGVLWLSTASNGLIRWDRSKGSITNITRRDGLPSNGLYAVYPDAHGQMWVPTDGGVARYDPRTGQIGIYTTADGISDNEFNRLSHTQGPDGRMYFGSMNGITAFHPEEVVSMTKSREAPLVLSSITRYDDKEEQLEDLRNTALRTDGVELRPHHRFLTIQMALLSYEDPLSILYGWRIDGIDEDWNVQREPNLRFVSLPYGDHTLRIRAKSGGSDWVDQQLALRISVVRPWHLRWWAIAGAILLVAAGVYALLRYRLGKVRAMMEMRNRIALDLHDEVGSTLSSVAILSTVVNRSKAERKPEESAMLDRIAENSAQAMESMNDIVWSVNSRYDKLGDVLDRMQTYTGPLADAEQWDLRLDVDDSIRSMKLNMNERKNLYLIFKEAVNNAAKYAQCDRLEVTMQNAEEGLELRITDNGKGIAEATLGNGTLGGNGLQGMRQRAEDIGGKLTIRSEPNEGTTVTLRFKPQHTY